MHAKNYRCRARLHPGGPRPQPFEGRQNRQLGPVQRPLRSASLPRHRRRSQSLHSRLRSARSPTHVAHTKRGTFHLQTRADLGARSSQSCTPRVPSTLTNQLHISRPRHSRRRHLTDCRRVSTLPMQCQESPNPLFCALRLNNTQRSRISFLSTKAQTIQTIPSVALTQGIPDQS